MLILRRDDVEGLLEGREIELTELVRRGYALHGEGRDVTPHSLFLGFPDDPESRIIALPSFVAAPARMAGLKWIASFPRNLRCGLPRASGVILLNSAETGRPIAMLEASAVSAKRTAAGAALATRALGGGPETVGLIGAGPINFEILRFLCRVIGPPPAVVVTDVDEARAIEFRRRCTEVLALAPPILVREARQVFEQARLVSIATSTARPHIAALPEGFAGGTILHISLRDLEPRIILASANVVDDADHVCRANTALHLAEGVAGHRDFIDADLDRLVREGRSWEPGRTTIFSPFGLGLLDILVADLVYRTARERSIGLTIDNFF